MAITTFPPRLTAAERDALRARLLQPPAPQTGALAEYRRLWFGRITDRYRGSPTRIVFVRIPRGPITRPAALSDARRGVVRELSAQPGVLLLDERAFDALERPELFFDGLHLNATGRADFSPALARLIVDRLNRPAAGS